MADNTTLNSMSGGDVCAMKDISGVEYVRGIPFPDLGADVTLGRFLAALAGAGEVG